MTVLNKFAVVKDGVVRNVDTSANTIAVGDIQVNGTSLSQTGVFAAFTGIITGTATSVTITANTAGVSGDSVDLVFNGSNTIAQTIAAWNAAHPTNAITLTSGNGSQIPSSQIRTLSGGINAGSAAIGDTATYMNFTPTAPTVAGVLAGIDRALANVSSGSQKVDKFTLNNTNITNKFVTLSFTPATPGAVILLIEDAGNMFYGVDFTVSGNELSWNGLSLDGILSNGDNLTITYSI